MKILFYNWVDYLDPEKRGGGVSIYQKNILEELARNKEHELFFLCSGISYDLINRSLRIEKIKHGNKLKAEDPLNNVQRYEIINSNVLSPGHLSFGDDQQIKDTKMYQLFLNFVKSNGPFDAIHFNNLEGISADFLSIKKDFPSTKVILSMHNYYPICSQVNLWYNEHELCEDFYYGKKCIDCIPNRAKKDVVIRSNASAYSLKKLGINPGNKFFYRPFVILAGIKKRIDNKIPDPRYKKEDIFFRVSGHPFIERRKSIIDLINNNCDYVLAVSKRVSEICINYGIKENIIKVDYIGTKFSELYESTPTPSGSILRNGKLSISYLGYMRRDKGFYFFSDALFYMPEELAKNINVVIAAKNTDNDELKRIYHQIWKFNNIYYVNGYNHQNLDSILQYTDIGIIPSLWEDNLPQVSIEYHSRKIPIITSNRGGAQELSGNKNFTYDSLKKEELYEILRAIINEELTHEDYWSTAKKPVSIKKHCENLIKEIYT